MRKLNGSDVALPWLTETAVGQMQKTLLEATGKVEESELAVTAFTVLLLKSVNGLIPNAFVDLDRVERCEAAIRRVLQNPRFNDSNIKLGATIGVMAFAIAQTIRGKARGYPEFNNCSTEHSYGEDEYRARMFAAPMWDQIGMRVGFNRSAESQYKTPAVNNPQKQIWLNWLCSQYVYTAALYGGLDDADAELMRDRWVSVQWDWLHTDPPTANMDFKRFWKKRGC